MSVSQLAEGSNERPPMFILLAMAAVLMAGFATICSHQYERNGARRVLLYEFAGFQRRFTTYYPASHYEDKTERQFALALLALEKSNLELAGEILPSLLDGARAVEATEALAVAEVRNGAPMVAAARLRQLIEAQPELWELKMTLVWALSQDGSDVALAAAEEVARSAGVATAEPYLWRAWEAIRRQRRAPRASQDGGRQSGQEARESLRPVESLLVLLIGGGLIAAAVVLARSVFGGESLILKSDATDGN